MRAIEFRSKIRENKISLSRKMQSELLNRGHVNSDAPRKKSGLEEALEDVAMDRLTTIHIPKNLKAV